MEPILGEIIIFGGNFAPRGWALCEGQLLAISQNTALFSILGTTYGGDGRTTFKLPDLRGRRPIQQGQGPGLSSHSLGQSGGAETHTLNINQLPGHNHGGSALTATFGVNEEDGDNDEPSGRNLGIAASGTPYNSSANDATLGASNKSPITVSGNTDNTGGNQFFSIVNPYLAVNYIIALVGVYPSRN